jgi:hypothetical protein
VPRHPRQVDVTVTRDGRAIGSSHLEPHYERVAPNGEECGPICFQTNATIAVTSP